MMHDLVRPGLVVVGDAAGLTLNTGFTLRGMDLAAGSGIAAAKTIHAALDTGDTSLNQLAGYPAELESMLRRPRHQDVCQGTRLPREPPDVHGLRTAR